MYVCVSIETITESVPIMTKKKKRFLAKRAVVEIAQWPAQVYLPSWCIIFPLVYHCHFIHCCKNVDCLFKCFVATLLFFSGRRTSTFFEQYPLLVWSRNQAKESPPHPPYHHQSKSTNFDCFTLSMVVPPCQCLVEAKD